MKVITDESPTKKKCLFRGKYGTCEIGPSIRWCAMNDGNECPFCIGLHDFLNQKGREFESDS